MTEKEETDLLLRVAQMMFGSNVRLHPKTLEAARNFFRQWIADTGVRL